MFVRQNIPLLMQAAKLELGKDEKGDRTRLVELSLVFDRLEFDLAAELGEEMFVHLFDDDERIRPNLKTVKLTPWVSLQRIVVASAPDAPVLATIRHAKVTEFTVTKKTDKDDTWLTATLKVVFDLGDRETREFLFHHFGEYRLFTFGAEQGDLYEADGLMPMARSVADMVKPLGKDGSMTMTTGGKSVTITADDAKRITESIDAADAADRKRGRVRKAH